MIQQHKPKNEGTYKSINFRKQFFFQLDIPSFLKGNIWKKKSFLKKLTSANWNNDDFWQASVELDASDWQVLEETWNKECAD